MMPSNDDVQFVLDADGHVSAVIVPIALWQEMASDTDYLLRNPVMRKRLLAARSRNGGVPLKVATDALGL
jgi:PHD/YefM family antitoxin component YafN of YafNO toxin-antitoxin module